ncbi:MAG: hypothetical protein LBT00_05140 [Spirochaetaceae bacterium]|jgi:hypothetical protein|nr:hypothetical protein [Spirochaetaceae bacterium]
MMDQIGLEQAHEIRGGVYDVVIRMGWLREMADIQYAECGVYKVYKNVMRH